MQVPEEAMDSGGDPDSGGDSDSGSASAVRMMRMVTGYELSQALYAVAKLDLATELLNGPLTPADLADRTGTHADSVYRLLRILSGVEVVHQPTPGTFGLTSLGETLAAGTANSVRDLTVMLLETHYAPFAQLVETVRSGVPAATVHYGQPFMDWMAETPERAAGFSAAMGNLADAVKRSVVRGYPLPPGDPVIDVGGADGSVLARLLRDNPDRWGQVFDLPTVVATARDTARRYGLEGRFELAEGDFFDSVPTGGVYVLSTVLHDWDDESAVRILRRIAEGAQPGARLMIVETIIPSGDDDHFAKFADLTMLGMITGRERTRAEFQRLLDAGGFELERVAAPDQSSPYSVLEASLR